MECDICHRGHDPVRQPFLCAVDARNQLYQGRLKSVQLLMENEELRNQIRGAIDSPSDTTSLASSVAQSKRVTVEGETSRILEAANKLRDEIKAARDEIQARKATIARRRSDLATASEGLMGRRSKQQKELEKASQRLNYRWSQSAEDMSTTRAFLYAEAADLYGLRRLSKDNPEYELGRIPVVNLLDMNSDTIQALEPEYITTSLGHITHIVMLASYYFAIRLPAEITLPHRDYPYPTINTIISSYQGKIPTFPGSSLSASPSTTSLENGSKSIPRARPLYLHKPLPQLLRDDPTAYSFFLEGVSLLAYDVAWLCNSQSIVFSGQNVADDICQMGRNLYNLLVESQAAVAAGAAATRAAHDKSGAKDREPKPEASWLGRFSHGTTFYHLTSSEGNDLVKSFKLPSPVKVVDRLKKKLVGDAPAPDWEVLDDDAWKVEDAFGQPRADQGNGVEGKPKSVGSSKGWMKVK
ncbi:unnamed protein product [Clonostachys rosea f. rosea IK726]|uniref:Uncharacterized protein n=1 Tax=Clonostachys rosea f. rosea IK726 TaxID=1349383 RepID=A0ACA9UQN6_BIOOC|nr:unnamed protein product [Clonostachys rosea f. rosea IK726]